MGTNQLGNEPVGRDRSRDTSSEVSAAAQAIAGAVQAGMGQLAWSGGCRGGRVSGGRLSLTRGSWQVDGTPRERQTQEGKGYSPTPPLSASHSTV